MHFKKVLLFTYYWPPSAGPGVQRWLKFCKYLQEFGIEVTVLTPENPNASNYDQSLINEIPTNLRIIKTNSFEPFDMYKILMGKNKKGESLSVGGINVFNDKSLKQRLSIYIRANFFIPDPRKGWNKYAYKAAVTLLKKETFDAVITTGPPHSTHLIGEKLKRKHGIKWMADFRDPWTNYFENKFYPKTARTKRIENELENKVVSSADAIIVVSPGLKKEFENRAKKIEVISNGFDEDDIADSSTQKGNKFVISYVGNFKPNQNCEAFWKAVKRVIKVIKEDSSITIEINLTGNVDNTIKKSIEKNGLNDYVNYKPYMPHKESTKEMVQSAALLFIVPQTDHNKLILTGKLFEYLASGVSFISIGPKGGNAADIINETGRGDIIDYADEEAMLNRIRYLYDQWKNSNKPLRLSYESVKKYSRRGVTEKLANMIHHV